MLSGLTSRWTMPAACAAARPSATPTRSSTPCRHVRRRCRCPRLERAAVDEFRDEIRPAVDIPDVVHREQVRMIERGEHAGFALEAGQPIGVRGEQRRQDLDRDVASELRVARAVDLAHPAGAHQLHDRRTGRGDRHVAADGRSRPSTAGRSAKLPACSCARSNDSTSARSDRSSPQAASRNAGRAAGLRSSAA